jgi:hypothetical protein
MALGAKGGRYLGLTTLPPQCADCLEVWGTQPPGTLKDCPGLFNDCITFTVTRNSTTHVLNFIYSRTQIAIVAVNMHHQSYVSLPNI